MTINRVWVKRSLLFFIIGGALTTGFMNCSQQGFSTVQDSADLGSQSNPNASPTPGSGATPTPTPGSSPTVSPTPTMTPSAPNLSAGCGNAGATTGYTTVNTVVDGNNTRRSFGLEVSSSYKSTTPMALTLLFHGAGGGIGDARGFGLAQATGALASSIMVYPQGIQFQNYGVGWNDSCNGYDMALFDNILTYIENNYCIDKNRIYVGGFSWGCDFSTALACCRPNKIRAVAAASCSDEFRTASDYKTYDNTCMNSATHPAIRFTHAPKEDGAYPAPYFATTSQLYQSWNSCTNSNTTAISPTGCVSYNSCQSQLIECTNVTGHSLPNNWNNDTWSFFSQFK